MTNAFLAVTVPFLITAVFLGHALKQRRHRRPTAEIEQVCSTDDVDMHSTPPATMEQCAYCAVLQRPCACRRPPRRILVPPPVWNPSAAAIVETISTDRLVSASMSESPTDAEQLAGTSINEYALGLASKREVEARLHREYEKSMRWWEDNIGW